MTPRSDRRPAPHLLLVVAAVMAALAALAIVAIDRPVARLLAGYEPSALWPRGMEALEWAIGWPLHPLTASFAVVAAMIAAMAVPRWRAYAPAAMFLAGTHVFARTAAGEFYNLLEAPTQPLLVVGEELRLREVDGKVRRRRPRRSSKARSRST